MNSPTISDLETEVSELKALVSTLLDKINKLTAENTALREEIRHLKKLKGQPKIRPNKKTSEDVENKDSQSTSPAETPPRSKRSRSPEPGRTAKSSPSSVREEICPTAGVQDNWKRKGYQDFTHVDVNLEFTTTRYRREVWLTPEGQTVIAPLPIHIKGRFGDNLRSMVLDLYHSCSVTQPLLLDWLHSHGCPISEGKLNALLTQGHELFHQEREDILETGIAGSRMLLVDDTGARHDGKNGYCTVIGNDTFTVFSSTDSKSRINFLTLLQGKRRSHILNPAALSYMKQVEMADRWIDTLSAYGEIHFLNEAAWKAFLDDHKLFAKEQRRKATEAVLKAGLLNNGCPEAMVIHSDVSARRKPSTNNSTTLIIVCNMPQTTLIPHL